MKNIYQNVRKNKANFLGASLPKYFFVIFAALGALSIWALKAVWPEQGPVYAAFFAGALIIAYCAISYATRLLTIREDIIGDNAYYLGFLFTLTSLAFALANFAADGNTNDIIKGFGIALSSTIVGVVMRVFFSQLRQDPDDIEKDARARIAETVSALNAELGSATVSFNEYRRSLDQSMAEAFQDFSAHTEKLNEASRNTVTALETLNTRISGIGAPDTLVNQKFANIFTNLDSASTKINGITDAQSKSNAEIIAATEALLKNVGVLTAQIESFQAQSSAAKESSKHLDDFVQKLDTVPHSLEKLTAGLAALVEQESTTIKKISAHADALEEQLERSRSYTEQTHMALSSMTRTLADKLS